MCIRDRVTSDRWIQMKQYVFWNSIFFYTVGVKLLLFVPEDQCLICKWLIVLHPDVGNLVALPVLNRQGAPL